MQSPCLPHKIYCNNLHSVVYVCYKHLDQLQAFGGPILTHRLGSPAQNKHPLLTIIVQFYHSFTISLFQNMTKGNVGRASIAVNITKQNRKTFTEWLSSLDKTWESPELRKWGKTSNMNKNGRGETSLKGAKPCHKQIFCLPFSFHLFLLNYLSTHSMCRVWEDLHIRARTHIFHRPRGHNTLQIPECDNSSDQ